MARTVEDVKILDDLLMKLKNIYNWNENKSFVMMAMKKCSDMFVYVCKFSIDNYFSQKNNYKFFFEILGIFYNTFYHISTSWYRNFL